MLSDLCDSRVGLQTVQERVSRGQGFAGLLMHTICCTPERLVLSANVFCCKAHKPMLWQSSCSAKQEQSNQVPRHAVPYWRCCCCCFMAAMSAFPFSDVFWKAIPCEPIHMSII